MMPSPKSFLRDVLIFQ